MLYESLVELHLNCTLSLQALVEYLKVICKMSELPELSNINFHNYRFVIRQYHHFVEILTFCQEKCG